MSYKVLVNASGITNNSSFIVFGDYPIPLQVTNDINVRQIPRGVTGFNLVRDTNYVDLKFSFTLVSQDQLDETPLPVLYQVQEIQLSNDPDFNEFLTLTTDSWALHNSLNYQSFTINVNNYLPTVSSLSLFSQGDSSGVYNSAVKPAGLTYDYVISNWRLSGSNGLQYVYAKFILTYKDSFGHSFNISVPYNYQLAYPVTISSQNPSAPNKPEPIYLNKPWVNNKAVWKFNKSSDTYTNSSENNDTIGRYTASFITIPYFDYIGKYNFFSSFKNNTNYVYRNVLVNEIPINETQPLLNLAVGLSSSYYFYRAGLTVTQTNYELPNIFDVVNSSFQNERFELVSNFTLQENYPGWFYQVHFSPQPPNTASSPDFSYNPYFIGYSSNYTIGFDINFGYNAAVSGITSNLYYDVFLNVYTWWLDPAVGVNSEGFRQVHLSPDAYDMFMSGGLLEVYFKPVKNERSTIIYTSSNYIMFNVLFTADNSDVTYTLVDDLLAYPNNTNPAFTDYVIANNFNFSFGNQTGAVPANMLIHEVAYGNIDLVLNADIGEGEIQYPPYSPFTYTTTNWQYSMNNFDWSVYKYNSVPQIEGAPEYQLATWSADEKSILLTGWGSTSITELKSNFQTIADNVSFEIQLDTGSTSWSSLSNCSYWITYNQPEIFENYIYNPILNGSDVNPCGPNKFISMGSSNVTGPVKILWDSQSPTSQWNEVLVVYQGDLTHANLRLEYAESFDGPWTDALLSSFTVNLYDYSPAYLTLNIPRNAFINPNNIGRYWKLTIDEFLNFYLSKVYLYNVDSGGVVQQSITSPGTLASYTLDFYFGFSNYANEVDTLSTIYDLNKKPSYLFIDPKNTGTFLVNNFVAAACFDSRTKKIFFRIRTPDGQYYEHCAGEYAPTTIFSSSYYTNWKLYLDTTRDSYDLPVSRIRLVNTIQNTEFSYEFNSPSLREKGLGFYAFVGTDKSVMIESAKIQSEDSIGIRNDLSTNLMQKTLMKAQTSANICKPYLGISLMSAQLENTYSTGQINFPDFNIYYSVDVCSYNNIILSGLYTLDDVVLAPKMLVLVHQQTNTLENGIYEVTAYGNWTRLDISNSLYVVKIANGDIYQDTFWWSEDYGITWMSNVVVFLVNDILTNNNFRSYYNYLAFPKLIEIKSAYIDSQLNNENNLLSLNKNRGTYFGIKVFATAKDWSSNTLYPSALLNNDWIDCTNSNLEYGHQPLYLDSGYFTNNTYLLQFNLSSIPKIPVYLLSDFQLQSNASVGSLGYLYEAYFADYFVAIKLPLINSNLNDDSNSNPTYTFPALIMNSKYDPNVDLTKSDSLYGFNFTQNLWFKAFEQFVQNSDNTLNQSLVYTRVSSQSIDLRKSHYSKLSDYVKVDINPPGAPILTSSQLENSRLIQFNATASDTNSGILAWRLVQSGDNKIETQYPWVNWSQFDISNSGSISFYSNTAPANKLLYSYEYNNGTLQALSSSYSGYPNWYQFQPDGYQPFDGFKRFYIEVVDGVGNVNRSNIVTEWYQSMAVLDTIGPSGSISFVDSSLQNPISITNQTANNIQINGQDIATDIKEFRYKLSSSNQWSNWTPMVNFAQINFDDSVIDGYQRIDLQLRDYGNNVSSVTPKWQEIKNIIYSNITFNVISNWYNPVKNLELVYVSGTYTKEYDNLVFVSYLSQSNVFYIAKIYSGYQATTLYFDSTDILLVTANNIPVDPSNYSIDYTNSLITFNDNFDTSNLSGTLNKFNAILFEWNNVSLTKIYDFTAKKEQIITALCPIDGYLIIGTAKGKIYYYDGNILYGPVFSAVVGTESVPISKIIQYQFVNETESYLYASTLNIPRIFRSSISGFKNNSNWLNIFDGIGYIKDINVIKQGYFSAVPWYQLSGGKNVAAAVAKISMSVNQTNVSNPGSGYAIAPSLTVINDPNDLTGSGAVLTPVMQGFLIKIVITNTGSGYITPPTVVIGNPTGINITLATASSQLNSLGGVSSVTLLTPGAGYLSAPLITFTGGSGNGATAYALLQYDNINSVAIANPGSGYTLTPTVTVTNGVGGIGANGAVNVTVSGGVSEIDITGTGFGYITTPSVVIDSPDVGQTALAFATIVNNSLSQIVIQNPGTNYTTIPNVNIVGGQGNDLNISLYGTAYGDGAIGISSILVVGMNSGYISNPIISFFGATIYENPIFEFIYDQDITLWQSSGSILDMAVAFDKIYCSLENNKVLVIDKNYSTDSFVFNSDTFKILNSQGISTFIFPDYNINTGINSYYGSLTQSPSYYTINKLWYYESNNNNQPQNILFASVLEDSTIFAKTNKENLKDTNKYNYARYVFDTNFGLRPNQWKYYHTTLDPNVGIGLTTNTLSFVEYTDNLSFTQNAMSIGIAVTYAKSEQVIFETLSFSDVNNIIGNADTVTLKNYVVQLDFVPVDLTGIVPSQGNQGITIFDGYNSYSVQVGIATTGQLNVTLSSSSYNVQSKTNGNTIQYINLGNVNESDFNTLTIYMQEINSSRQLNIFIDNQYTPIISATNVFDKTNEIKFRLGKVDILSDSSQLLWKEMRYKINSVYCPIKPAITDFTPFTVLPSTGPVKGFFEDEIGTAYAITQGIGEYYFSSSPEDKIAKMWCFNDAVGIWTNLNITQNLDVINNYPYGLANPYGAIKYQNTFLAIGQKNNVGIDTSFLLN